MSGWRAGLVAFAVGAVVLAAGYLLGGDRPLVDGAPTSPPSPGADVSLACVDSLSEACDSIGAVLGVRVERWTPGSPVEEGSVVVASEGDLPEGGTPLGRSPIVVGLWLERASALRAECGEIDLACISRAIGGRWADMGGNPSWGDVKLGLADPTRSEPGMLAWTVVTEIAEPAAIDRSLRLTAATAGALTRDMVAIGVARADLVVTTELAVASQMENAIGRGGRLEITYPETSPWVVYAAGDGGRTGALLDRLQSPEVRQLLAEAGMRPLEGDPVGLPEGLGTPGAPEPFPDDAARGTLVALWEDLRG